MFHCNKWLSKSDDDKQILRELTCGTAAKGSGTPDMKDRVCKCEYNMKHFPSVCVSPQGM